MIPASNTRSSSVNRHNSSSPTANGTPPLTVTPSSVSTLLANSSSSHDNQRLLKIRRFLGALFQFGQDTNADVGDRLRSLVLSLAVSTSLFSTSCFTTTTLIYYRAVVCQSKNFRSLFKRRLISHCDQMSFHFYDLIYHFCSEKSTV